jgi:hypothetical protein
MRQGRAPLRAEGHVTITTKVLKIAKSLVRVAVQRKAGTIQKDEFRYFKRHDTTIQEAAVQRAYYLAAVARQNKEVEDNNLRMQGFGALLLNVKPASETEVVLAQ